MFDEYLARWGLVPDGQSFTSLTGRLLPVRCGEEPAILKLTSSTDEVRGGSLLEWWGGEGAARVLARDGHAILLERATGQRSLADMARSGADDEACEILCSVLARVHVPRANALPELVPLTAWFRDLEPAAAEHGGVLEIAAKVARELLAQQREVRPLHGDLHHGNVLDFGARGWLGIDPKGLFGDRYFDYANIFTNPDLDDPARPVATEHGRFERRLSVVVKCASLDREKLLRWILAWTGLSAAWFLGDGDREMASIDLTIAQLAAKELEL